MKNPLKSLWALLGILLSASAWAASDSRPPRIEAQVSRSGKYRIRASLENWSFEGKVSAPQGVSIHQHRGRDAIGAYREAAFFPLGASSRIAPRYSIRVYPKQGIALFREEIRSAPANTARFPTWDSYPQDVQSLSHQSAEFAPTIQGLSGDAPWVFFSPSGSSFILSPADHFMISNCFLSAENAISVGIEPQVDETPDHLSITSILAFGRGVHEAYENWGEALTRLSRKIAPRNDSDPVLNTLGYWTDNRSSYWYNFDLSLGYEGMLQALKDEFARNGIHLGHFQLDSWWYLKGGDANATPPLPVSWKQSNYNHGIYLYDAAPELFPDGLAPFQSRLGLPLVTHARWVDPSSPYMSEYRFSNQVSVDPAYWEMIMDGLEKDGVRIYEQDWLNSNALPRLDRIHDADDFLDQMSIAASKHGIGLQYCMPLARHFLQGSRYSNLKTIRPSGDGFERSRWNQFLYGSHLAAALGIWPWTDVVFSSARENLLISTLSGGIVGVGDRLSEDSSPGDFSNPSYCAKSLNCTSLNVKNLQSAARADGVVVKPDSPLLPLDSSYVALSGFAPNSPPMVAAAYTHARSGERLAAYVFAYTQQGSSSEKFTLNPRELGFEGDVYVYDYFSKKGERVAGGGSYTSQASVNGSYLVVAPIDSDRALLGDLGLYATLGEKRVTIHRDGDSGIFMTLHFAAGESELSLSGYALDESAAAPPRARQGATVSSSYDSPSGLFSWAILRPLEAPLDQPVDVDLELAPLTQASR